MAFQTNILRDGEWVTETVNLQAALRASAAPRPSSDPPPEPPVCGLLSKTLVESPILRWILPVRLRSNSHNDIAFIGDSFVQVSELRRDGQLHEVLKKNDFSSRIRSAVVLGDSLEHGLDDDAHAGMTNPEKATQFMDYSKTSKKPTRVGHLPPQLLVLMLESGSCIFLFIRDRLAGDLEFFDIKYECPTRLAYLGYHLAVDPSSRYMAAASPDGIFVVYELESLVTLNTQYVTNGTFSPVKSIRYRAIQGVIHKLEFLYPRPEDDYHIILLLIVIRKERNQRTPISRMVTYEWELGDNLISTFAEEQIGTRLPREHRMPMLLIPLRFKTAFFAVSPLFIGVVKYALSGSPEFELLETDTPRCTKFHHGVCEPLWTSWARPFRRKQYFEKTDIIYLAREDGAIIHIEIDAAELVPSVTNVGCIETNIDTAFTTAYDIFSDVLIIGGDSGPGGVWKLAPRSDLEKVSVLHNWSPVIDVATTNEHSTWVPKSSETANTRQRALPNNLRKMDSIFSASGRGLQGSVTQWRWGIRARIGLDIESGEPIKHAWTFMIEERLYGLLALPNSSVVLRFSGDLGQIDALSAEQTHFDVASRTLHAIQVSHEAIVQATEVSINIIGTSASQSSRTALQDLLGIPGAFAETAFCVHNIVVLSTHSGHSSQLHVLQAEGTRFSRTSSWSAQGEVTCVSAFVVSGNHFVVAASVLDGEPWISVYSLDGHPLTGRAINSGSETGIGSRLEALTSIYVVYQGYDGANIIFGSRCGHLLTARVSEHGPVHITWKVDVVGVGRVDVFPAFGLINERSAAFACCDNNLIMMSDFSQHYCKFSRMHYVWPTDSNDPSMPSPTIHSIAALQQNLSNNSDHMSLMILAGSRMLVADIRSQASHVPRSIPLGGTPSRIIFSQTLNCLVAALSKDDKPTLAFIDPESGSVISRSTDKDRNPVEFISGLGHAGDRIYCLHEWLYVKDGKTFPFILVTTKGGRLIIVSTEKNTNKRGEAGEGARLLFWTRYKKMLAKPIYSVVGDAEGLVFCVDRTLHWDVLDLAEKKLKPMKEFELDSPATTLRVVNGKIHALTTMHSLEVIDHRAENNREMSLIHTDRLSRRTVHMIDVGDPDDSPGQWPMTLLSDHSGGVTGVWVPRGLHNKELEVVLEGKLPSSVRRFARARSWPPWLASERRKRRYGKMLSTADGAEIISVSLDGSMQHLTLLNLELWRFLCLVQNLAKRNSTINPLTNIEHAVSDIDDDIELEPQPHQKAMHIDGDLLDKCLQQRALETIVGTEDGMDLLCEYLDSLEGGQCTEDFRDRYDLSEQRDKMYFDLAYRVLEYLLAPAF